MECGAYRLMTEACGFDAICLDGTGLETTSPRNHRRTNWGSVAISENWLLRPSVEDSLAAISDGLLASRSNSAGPDHEEPSGNVQTPGNCASINSPLTIDIAMPSATTIGECSRGTGRVTSAETLNRVQVGRSIQRDRPLRPSSSTFQALPA